MFPKIARYHAVFHLLLHYCCCFLNSRNHWPSWIIIPHHRSDSSIIPDALAELLPLPDHSSSLKSIGRHSPSSLDVKPFSWCTRNITAASWRFVRIDDHVDSFPIIVLYPALFRLFLRPYGCFLSIRHHLPGWSIVPKNSPISSNIPAPPASLFLFPELSSSLRSMDHHISTQSIDIKHHPAALAELRLPPWSFIIVERHESSCPIIARCQSLFMMPPRHYCCSLTFRHNWRTWLLCTRHLYMSRILPAVLAALRKFPEHPSSLTRMNHCSQI